MDYDQKIEIEPRKFVAPEYIFGADARKMAINYVKKLAGEKILLVTDGGLLQTPWIKEIEDDLQLNEIDYIIFHDISPNPRDNEVVMGVNVYENENCNLILAIGGGSVLDCAKGIGIVATNKQPIECFEGVDKIKTPIPPLVCIPTTSGTSADVSQFAIINREKERYKMAIISKATVPDVALIDPIVLTTMSKSLTVFTGMDALSHAFEAYVSNASSAFTDLYALEAIKIINSSLKNSVDNPNDIQLRAKTMLASLYAGLAFSNASLGCVHSLAHSLGGFLDLPHGECNAILLPHVVDYNFYQAKEKYIKIAQLLNLNIDSDDEAKAKRSLIEYLRNLQLSLGVDPFLKKRGVSPDIITALAEKAYNDPCNATNPREPKKSDLQAIYLQAL
ncbi:alcohol dehydrogenase-like regulatory protein ErcA [Salinivirga cyanobacteriivorans]